MLFTTENSFLFIMKISEMIDFQDVMFIWLEECEQSVSKELIYENYFAKPFIQKTEKYYQLKAVFDFEHGDYSRIFGKGLNGIRILSFLYPLSLIDYSLYQ